MLGYGHRRHDVEIQVVILVVPPGHPCLSPLFLRFLLLFVVPRFPLLSPRFRFLLCVFFTSNRSFYPSTSSTPSVRADPSYIEIQTSSGHKITTDILHCNAVTIQCPAIILGTTGMTYKCQQFRCVDREKTQMLRVV